VEAAAAAVNSPDATAAPDISAETLGTPPPKRAKGARAAEPRILSAASPMAGAKKHKEKQITPPSKGRAAAAEAPIVAALPVAAELASLASSPADNGVPRRRKRRSGTHPYPLSLSSFSPSPSLSVAICPSLTAMVYGGLISNRWPIYRRSQARIKEGKLRSHR